MPSCPSGRGAAGPQTGVRRRVALYRQHPASTGLGGPADDLARLAGADPGQLADVLDDHQEVDGTVKAAAIIQAADRLVGVGVRHAEDLDPDDPRQRAASCSVHGLCPVTWRYLGVLAGTPGVEADPWIIRFVEETLGRRVPTVEAERLVTAVAARSDVSPSTLDHAIRAHTRRQA